MPILRSLTKAQSNKVNWNSIRIQLISRALIATERKEAITQHNVTLKLN